MYNCTLLRSKVLRPLARLSYGNTRWRVSSPTIPNILQVDRQSSRNSIATRFSSHQSMITTTLGKVVPSTGNSRIDAELQGGHRIIRHDMTCAEFHDSVWGFVIYRCVEGNDAAWNSIVEQLRNSIQKDLEDEQFQDLLPFHDLHVIDEKSLYGASIDEVRAHFQAWVPKSLEARLRPGTKCTIPELSHLGVNSTPRYEYFLMVDEICLESVEYASYLGPVVKLVNPDWECPWSPEEKLQGVHPPFHDGITEDHEEDVGWMYMNVLWYLGQYDGFHGASWSDIYVRPPFIDWFEDESNVVGHWRRKNGTKQEKDVIKTQL